MLKRVISAIAIMAFIFTQCGIGYALRPQGVEGKATGAVGTALKSVAQAAARGGYEQNLIEHLQLEAIILREMILKAIARAKSGHPGGSLSIADITTALYFDVLNYNSMDPINPDRDRFVLSKGHAAPALYAALAQAGFISRDELRKLRQMDGILEGHPSMKSTPGIDMTTGSLGIGLGVASGMALAAKIQERQSKIFTVIGDGEIQEGSIDEAARFAGENKLDNLVAILDNNGLQIDGSTSSVDPSNVREVWANRGWYVMEIDGHDMAQIISTLRDARNNKTGKPILIIATTIKGKGVSFMEGEAGWHGKAPDKQQLGSALAELEDVKKRLLDETGITMRKHAAWRRGTIAKIRANLPGNKKDTNAVSLNYPKPSNEYKPGDLVPTRVAFGSYLTDLAGQDPSIIALSADLRGPVGMDGIAKQYGTISVEDLAGRYLEIGIAEQNMAAVAAGLSTFGLKPVIATFDVFMGRMADQLRMIAYASLPVLIIGTHTGVGVGEDGPTHTGREGADLLRNLGIEVFEPADATETVVCMQEALRLIAAGKPAYIRLTRQAVEVQDRNAVSDWQKEIADHGLYTICDTRDSKVTKPDVVLIVSGATASEAVKAAKQLKEQDGRSAVVINIVSITRAYRNKEYFVSLLASLKAQNVPIITVQDALPQILGGLVGEMITQVPMPKVNGVVIPLGVADYATSAPGPELYEKYKINAKGIYATACTAGAAVGNIARAIGMPADKSAVVGAAGILSDQNIALLQQALQKALSKAKQINRSLPVSSISISRSRAGKSQYSFQKNGMPEYIGLDFDGKPLDLPQELSDWMGKAGVEDIVFSSGIIEAQGQSLSSAALLFIGAIHSFLNSQLSQGLPVRNTFFKDETTGLVFSAARINGDSKIMKAMEFTTEKERGRYKTYVSVNLAASAASQTASEAGAAGELTFDEQIAAANSVGIEEIERVKELLLDKSPQDREKLFVLLRKDGVMESLPDDILLSCTVLVDIKYFPSNRAIKLLTTRAENEVATFNWLCQIVSGEVSVGSAKEMYNVFLILEEVKNPASVGSLSLAASRITKIEEGDYETLHSSSAYAVRILKGLHASGVIKEDDVTDVLISVVKSVEYRYDESASQPKSKYSWPVNEALRLLSVFQPNEKILETMKWVISSNINSNVKEIAKAYLARVAAPVAAQSAGIVDDGALELDALNRERLGAVSPQLMVPSGEKKLCVVVTPEAVKTGLPLLIQQMGLEDISVVQLNQEDMDLLQGESKQVAGGLLLEIAGDHDVKRLKVCALEDESLNLSESDKASFFDILRLNPLSIAQQMRETLKSFGIEFAAGDDALQAVREALETARIMTETQV